MKLSSPRLWNFSRQEDIYVSLLLVFAPRSLLVGGLTSKFLKKRKKRQTKYSKTFLYVKTITRSAVSIAALWKSRTSEKRSRCISQIDVIDLINCERSWPWRQSLGSNWLIYIHEEMSRSVGEHNSRDMAGDGQLSTFSPVNARVWNFTDDIAAQSNCIKLNRANKRWKRRLSYV